jgi:hypothetical protein
MPAQQAAIALDKNDPELRAILTEIEADAEKARLMAHGISSVVLKPFMRSASNQGATQQLVGPERRERVSHQAWYGEGGVNSRRPVNSEIRPTREELIEIRAADSH